MTDETTEIDAEEAALDETPVVDEQAESADKTEDTEAVSQPEQPPLNLPEPDLASIVGVFSTQAMLALGAFPNPATGKTEVQLEMARHMIDMIALIEKKTIGNLTTDETEMLDATLHHLRMSFLELSKTEKS